MKKREFLRVGIGLGMSTFAYPTLSEVFDSIPALSPLELAKNEDFWKGIRKGYKLKPDYINLENGYYCISPEETINNFIEHIKDVNYQGSYYMRTVQWDNKAKVAEKVAAIIGATKEEVVITRNTTESLDTIIGGYPWKNGDEAVFAAQDYGAMKNMFYLQAERHGIKNVEVSIPNHPDSDEEIVEIYRNAITDKTKLLMVCHMINITGHILPIRKICDMAHERGVDVMVDGAHAFAQIQFNIADLDCDYYGCSLHKWLSTPLGAGMLYAKKSKIAQIWPLFAEGKIEADNIKKLNHTGTHPVHTDLAIINAIDYYDKLGSENKEERLRYIQRYWSDQLRAHPNIDLNTPREVHKSCAIANVGVKGMKPSDLSKTLLDEYNIWTVAIDGHGVHGCRITPNVYTTLEELDQFIDAMKKIAKK